MSKVRNLEDITAWARRAGRQLRDLPELAGAG
jgi:hypothetical protein